MNIIVLGHNHTTASLESRELLAFDADHLRAALRSLHDLDIVHEAVILSTCNRNELYCVVSDATAARETLTGFLLDFHDAAEADLDTTLYAHLDADAVDHLFSVASGADSLIIGETQIFSQLKAAFQIARTMNVTGPILNRLFHRCFETGKKVRHQTNISQGAVSVSFAAAALAKKIFTTLEHKTILLIGAGETTELTAMNLANNGADNFIVANRTYKKAVELAEYLSGTPIELSDITHFSEQADIIVSSTASSNLILTKSDIADLMHKRKNDPLFIIDLAVPRDIDPGAAKLYNVFLYDIDDLNAIAEDNKKQRQKEIVRAKEIIGDSVRVFMEWYQTLDVTPTLVTLRRHFEDVRTTEVERYGRKLSAEQKQIIDEATRSLLNKLLHQPSIEMKQAAKNGSGYILTQSIRKLFNLWDSDE